ncbi:MAG: hypothetical protein V7637_3729 [Mycobacteriales bacterium]|jgi:ATP synthase protein I
MSAGQAAGQPALGAARSTVLPTVLVGVVLAVVSGVVAGWPGAVGAGLGAAVVVAFFGLDLLALRSASRRFPDAPVQLALLGYLAKLVGLGVLLWLVRDSAAIDATAFAVAAMAGTAVWLLGQIRLVGRLVRQPAPELDPAGPRDAPADPAGAAAPADPADLEATS